VALPSPSDSLSLLSPLLTRGLLLGVWLCLSAATMSQAVSQQPRYLAEIELHTEAELLQLLERAQQLSDEGVIQADSAYPVRFVLHGPEVRVLLSENYDQHRQTVDLARELSRRGLVDVRVCETWMGSQRITGDQLPPFIGTVPYGPGEERRLLREEEYVYF